MPRLVIVTEIISPYRIPLFNRLAEDRDLDLHVIFLAETDTSLRQWDVYKDEIKFSYQVLPSWKRRIGKYNLLVNTGLLRALREASPSVILCGGYSYLASWQALVWAASREVPFLLWSESHLHELRRRSKILEFMKHEFLKSCAGFVVPGQSAFEYLRAFGVPDRRVYVAPNAVDNARFAAIASQTRANALRTRTELALPERYILFAGRLVPEKGVFELLDAYRQLDAEVRKEVGLVFVGDGPQRARLERIASTIFPGTVKFAGFAQRDALAKYYALAEMLVLATYTDAWGLVVNEAMACGQPIILSKNAGCAMDLVRDNWNGVLIPPRDIPSLTAAIRNFAKDSRLRATMSANSLQRIEKYSPEEWSKGVKRAVFAVARGA